MYVYIYTYQEHGTTILVVIQVPTVGFEMAKARVLGLWVRIRGLGPVQTTGPSQLALTNITIIIAGSDYQAYMEIMGLTKKVCFAS